MHFNFIIAYLTLGLSINFGISKLDKIEMLDDSRESDKALSPHLVIMFWFILLASFCYYFIKEFKKQ